MEPRAERYTGPESVSVVIPTSRGGADLERCLASLAAQRTTGVEVIVVDNASNDTVVAALPARFPGLVLLHNDSNLGFVGACNQGIEIAKGEWILLLNDDTELQADALEALVDALRRNGSWGACQAKLLLMDDPTRLDTAGSFLTKTGFLIHRGSLGPERDYTASDEIFAAKGAALLLRREALEQVGVFDSDFFAYFEETDLCWRLWLAGWSVGFAAEARVLHKLGATAGGLPSDFVQFHSFKNRLRTLLKNLGLARALWMVPYHVALCLGLAGWYALRGKPRLVGAIIRALAWNVAHFPSTLRKRREVQKIRRVPDRALMPRIMRKSELRTLAGYAGIVADAEDQKPGSAETTSA
jgi:GT2 family glycosyltransferase